MPTLSFERTHGVLRLDFAGVFTSEHLDRIDPALIAFLGKEGGRHEDVRSLYDLSKVTVLAVPQSRFAERARQPSIGNLPRIVVAPRDAGEEFGQSYRREKQFSRHEQPIIVATLADAYELLGLSGPRFQPVAP